MLFVQKPKGCWSALIYLKTSSLPHLWLVVVYNCHVYPDTVKTFSLCDLIDWISWSRYIFMVKATFSQKHHFKLEYPFNIVNQYKLTWWKMNCYKTGASIIQILNVFQILNISFFFSSSPFLNQIFHVMPLPVSDLTLNSICSHFAFCPYAVYFSILLSD